jgi:hypothetical protein
MPAPRVSPDDKKPHGALPGQRDSASSISNGSTISPIPIQAAAPRRDSCHNDLAIDDDEEKKIGSRDEPEAQQVAPEEGRTRMETALVVAALASALFLAALDITIVTVAIPTITQEFESTAGYTWIGSAYMLASAAMAPMWGKISVST